ncbi:MAG: hypothetical protein JNN07_27045 [Verrucomicrobiales bacterium]|nr:hypothetical protein [Verrucomicrobiales bacterium]
MTEVIAWLEGNWFSLVQSLGIIASILLTAATMRRDRTSRRIGDYLALTTEHRELWGDLHRRADLARVVSAEVDLLAQPLSTAEEEFLLLVIVHFHTGWLLAKQGSLVDLEVLAQDARAFFRLPMPKLVWCRTRSVRDPAFVHFIDSACARSPRQRHPCRLLLKRAARRTTRSVSRWLAAVRRPILTLPRALMQRSKRPVSLLRKLPGQRRPR